MKLFVTGADGILGSDFVRRAGEAGHTVFRLSRREVVQHDAMTVVRDMRDLIPDDVPMGTDVIVHFATGRDGDDAEVIRTSIEGTQRLLEAAIERQVPHFIHLSSMSVYAKHPTQGRVRGEGDLDPRPELRGSYAASKTMTEKSLWERVCASGAGCTALTILRPGLVYGPELGGVLWETAARLPLGLVLGRGRASQTVPLVEIGDVSRGILGVISNGPVAGKVRVFDVLSKAPRKATFLERYSYLSGQPARGVWLPKWLMLTLAKVLDVVSPTPPTRRTSGVRQMYEWDVASLPSEDFWNEIGLRPQADADDAIRATLTLDREPGMAPEFANVVKGRAHSIVLAAETPTPNQGRAHDLLIVGAGRIMTDMHMPAIAAVSGYRVLGVVEPNDALAKKAVERFPGARRYSSVKDVEPSAWENLTAVIATPGSTHFGLIQDVMAKGGGLMVEKPVVLQDQELTQVIAQQSSTTSKPLTVIHNYRLFPSSLKLWRFLATHDVGALVQAHVVYHGARLSLAPARWMQEEKRHRVLLLDQAIHSLDIAFVLGGAVASVDHVSVTDRKNSPATLAIVGKASLVSGASLQFDLSLVGSAQRRVITLEFERCVCQLSWYPDGFRVLPSKANPFDDIASSVAQLAQYGRERILMRRALVRPLFAPHHMLYQHHLNRVTGNAEEPSPFSIHGVKDTMSSLLRLADEVYA